MSVLNWSGVLSPGAARRAPGEPAEDLVHLATFGVVGAWAVAGLLVAPALLRRVARRESGSSVAARREKALQHVG
jgi:ABC-2 type transport system permease protein